MLTLWRSRDPMFRRDRELDRLFGWSSDNGHAQAYAPAVDIEEAESEFVLTADLPGLEEKDLDIQVHDNTLVLSGKREATQEERTERGYYSERRYGSFCRQFRLGTNVDDGKIQASYKNGVLTVVLPKKEEAKPRQIPVHAS